MGEKKIRLKIHLKAKIIEKYDSIDAFAKLLNIRPENLSKICHQYHGDIKGSLMLKISKLLNMDPRDIWETLE